MNKENVRKAIAIMKRAGKVKMEYWQGQEDVRIVTTEEEVHTCGNGACFAGWVAVSPEFQADGGGVDDDIGCPVLKGNKGSLAIAEWLDIPLDLAYRFVSGSEDFYAPIPFEDVQAPPVIEKLELLLQGELRI